MDLGRIIYQGEAARVNPPPYICWFVMCLSYVCVGYLAHTADMEVGGKVAEGVTPYEGLYLRFPYSEHHQLSPGQVGIVCNVEFFTLAHGA